MKAKSNANGEFSFADVPGGKYFVYVEPADREVPAGWRQVAQILTTAELAAAPVKIQVSGNVPPAPPMSAPASAWNATRIMKPSKHPAPPGHPGHRQAKQAAGLLPLPGFQPGPDKLMAGTKFWFHGYDKTRGFDKYQISDKAPADPASVSFTATFYKDGRQAQVPYRECQGCRRSGAGLSGGTGLRRRRVQAALPGPRRPQPVPLRAVQPERR
jgi:hypothetical protein